MAEWWVFGAAASLAAGVVFLLTRPALSGLALDRPNARSLHSKVVPRTGGLAVCVTALILGLWLDTPVQGVMWLGLGLGLISLADDRWGLPIYLRFAAHLLAALGVVYLLGAWSRTMLVALPLVLVLVWSINLYNFMDGADGMAGGMALVGFTVLALGAPGTSLAMAAWALAGAALGFLLFNWSPARIFMGDCGSVPLGFLAASLGLAGVVSEVWPAWFPLWVFSAFVVDATLTLLKRLLRGERVWQAHREHYYQRLIRMGQSHNRVAGAWMVWSALLGGAALGLRSSSHAWLACPILLCVYAVIARMIDKRWEEYQDAHAADQA